MILLLPVLLAIVQAEASSQNANQIANARAPAGGATADQQAPTPAQIVERAIALLREHHINSASADWNRITSETYRRIAGEADRRTVYEAIQYVIDTLGERHTALRAPPSWSQSGGAPRPLDLPRGELIQGRFAMVQLPGLMAPQEQEAQYESVLKEALLTLSGRSVCGWIIDLRQNSGGSMWPMMRGLDPLLGSAPFGSFRSRANELAYWARTYNGIRPARAAEDRAPFFSLANANAPVALLLGPRTASSGEMVAIALAGRSGVRTFGRPTAGLSTANRTFPLPDGSRLSITTARVRDRTGHEYAGPIIPDEEATDDEVLERAIRWLASRPCQPASRPER